MKLYHLVPSAMQGTTLYPLHILRDIMPDQYEAAVAKYAGRPEVLEQTIPGLGSWGDVLHLSPVHPCKLLAALRSAGSSVRIQQKAVCVDSSKLDLDLLRVMEFVTTSDAFTIEFKSFAEVHIMDDVPPYTQAYYRERLAAGTRPMLFQGVTHVLYRGSLDIKDLPIIDIV